MVKYFRLAVKHYLDFKMSEDPYKKAHAKFLEESNKQIQ